MRRILRRRPSGSMVVAFVALLVAMGGTGYAAITLPKNSVGTAQLKKNAVTTKKIKNGAVTSTKVKNGSLLSADFKSGQLPAGPQGPRGPEGPQGPKGEGGQVGPTFGSALANPGDPVPPATPDTLVVNAEWTHTFVTPTSGRLLVFASLRVLGVSCTVGFGNAFLYLDGVGVPGSGQRRPDAGVAANQFTAIALTGVVPAGEHTLTIALDCPMGNRTADSSSSDGDLGAVLIGS